jgi:hypothetical protein
MKRKLLFLTASTLMFCAGTLPAIAATGIGFLGVSMPPAFPPVPGIAVPQPSPSSPPPGPRRRLPQLRLVATQVDAWTQAVTGISAVAWAMFILTAAANPAFGPASGCNVVEQI